MPPQTRQQRKRRVEYLPQEIITIILSFLPLKSLLRFASVSKRWYHLILQDSSFAKLHFKVCSKQNSLGHRLLISTDSTHELESLDLTTPESSVREIVNFEFQKPERVLFLLGSCSGLVFLVFERENFWVCNPSIGKSKELTAPNVYTDDLQGDSDSHCFHGVGYSSATDDYKVVLGRFDFLSYDDEDYNDDEDFCVTIGIFSVKDNAWKSINEVPSDIIIGEEGTLSNEALHWMNCEDGHKDQVVAFDLATEEFGVMHLPDFGQDGKAFGSLGVSVGGSLCVLRFPDVAFDRVDFWVMGEYDVHESWCKLSSLKFSGVSKNLFGHRQFLITGKNTVMKRCSEGKWMELINLDHKKKKKVGQEYSVSINVSEEAHIIHYEETLVWIDDQTRIF